MKRSRATCKRNHRNENYSRGGRVRIQATSASTSSSVILEKCALERFAIVGASGAPFWPIPCVIARLSSSSVHARTPFVGWEVMLEATATPARVRKSFPPAQRRPLGSEAPPDLPVWQLMHLAMEARYRPRFNRSDKSASVKGASAPGIAGRCSSAPPVCCGGRLELTGAAARKKPMIAFRSCGVSTRYDSEGITGARRPVGPTPSTIAARIRASDQAPIPAWWSGEMFEPRTM